MPMAMRRRPIEALFHPPSSALPSFQGSICTATRSARCTHQVVSAGVSRAHPASPGFAEARPAPCAQCNPPIRVENSWRIMQEQGKAEVQAVGGAYRRAAVGSHRLGPPPGSAFPYVWTQVSCPSRTSSCSKSWRTPAPPRLLALPPCASACATPRASSRRCRPLPRRRASSSRRGERGAAAGHKRAGRWHLVPLPGSTCAAQPAPHQPAPRACRRTAASGAWTSASRLQSQKHASACPLTWTLRSCSSR